MNASVKPLPRVDLDSEPFWRAAADNRLVGQRCGVCGIWRWPPREHCPACHAESSVWQDVTGTGKIVGIVVTHRPMNPAFIEDLPLALVHVALDGTDEQFVLQSVLQRGEWTDAKVGSSVTVQFTPASDNVVLPTFTLKTHSQK